MRKNVKSLVHEPAGGPVAAWAPYDGRVFQAGNSFVHACMDATMAMHALSAKIRELEKSIQQIGKASTRSKAASKAVKAPNQHALAPRPGEDSVASRQA
jgi:hypothetical protein